MKCAERKIEKNLDVGAVGIGASDVLDEGDLFEDILSFLSLVQAAVDDGQRQCLTVPEENECRHIEKLIQLAGDSGNSNNVVQ